MKKILAFAFIVTLSYAASAQVGVISADSLRLGNPAGTGGVALFGKTYLKNITLGSSFDSILVRNANGSIRMVPRSVLFSAFATAADLSSYQTLANLSSDLTPSATKYPSVNAVNAGIAAAIAANTVDSTKFIWNQTANVQNASMRINGNIGVEWGNSIGFANSGQGIRNAIFATDRLFVFKDALRGPDPLSNAAGAMMHFNVDNTVDFTNTNMLQANRIVYVGVSNIAGTPPTDGILSSGESGTGPTNLPGSDLRIRAGRGTGNNTEKGNILFYTPEAGSSGGTEQAYIEKLRIARSGIGINNSNPAEALDIIGKVLVSSAPTAPTGVVRKQDLEDAVAAIDLSSYQTLANLSSDLTPSTTKYPSVNAVNAGIAAAVAAIDLSGYLPLAGGALTGDVTTSGRVGIGNTASNARLEVTQATGEVFRADAASGALRIVADQTGISLGGAIMAYGNILPNANVTRNLGSSSSRWDAIYGHDINITGGLAASGTGAFGSTVTLGGGASLNLTSGDIKYLSNGGFGLLSADDNRQLTVTNSGIGVTNALAVGGTLSGTSATFSGNVTSNGFVKSGGTSSQFLKADGSVDNNTYLTGSSLNSYLPLSGGSLSGALNGTSASFSSTITAGSVDANIRLKGGNTDETDGFVGTAPNGMLYFRNWAGTRGFTINSSNVLAHTGALNVSGSGTFAGNVIPGENNTYDLGHSSYRWNYLYANSAFLSGALSASGDGTFGGNVTGANLNISNWNSAYGWGNHAGAGYMTASSTNTLTNKSGNISQWTNDAGYLTSSGSLAWGNITGKPSFATVATSGAYSDLSGKPTAVSAFSNDAGYLTASSTNTLSNKSGNISQWTNDTGYITGSSLGSYLPLSGGTLSGSLSGTSSSFSGDVSASTFSGNVASNYLNKQGNTYYQANTWIQLNGAYGLYAPSYNAAHFYPNASGSYGAWTTSGSKGGYSGIYDAYSGTTYGMYDASGNGGAYDGASGWHYYWNKSTQSLGIGGSSTQSGYRATVNGALYTAGAGYFTGTVTAPTFSGALSGNASTATSSTQFMSTSHAGSYYLVNNWDGTYWNVTSNHGSPVRVGYANTAGSVAWGNVSGTPTIPTNTNQLTNGAGFITGEADNLQSVTGRSSSTPYNMSIGKGASNSIADGSAFFFASDFSGSPTYSQAWQLGADGEMINFGYNSGTWSPNFRMYRDGNSWTKENFTAGGNITAYSDSRLKTNIHTLTSVSEALRNIRAVEYDRIDSKEHHVGFIAQEVQKYFPALVLTGSDEKKTLSMAYQNFTAPLLKGWQEHDTLIQQQSAQIKQQDERIAQLERELAGLKEMIKRAEK